MIECRVCRAVQIDNTVFCEECGNYLLQNKSRDTAPLETVDIGWVGRRTNGHHAGTSLPADSAYLVVCLKIEAGRREIELILNRVITLGRMDPTQNIFPEVDLTYDSSLAKSVSRRHASIFWKEGQVLIEDLASINGTFLNGKRLIPFLPEALGDGDILQLGKFLIEVKIKVAPS